MSASAPIPCTGPALIFPGICTLYPVLEMPNLATSSQHNSLSVHSLHGLLVLCFGFSFKLTSFSGSTTSADKPGQKPFPLASSSQLFSIAADARKTRFLFPETPHLPTFQWPCLFLKGLSARFSKHLTTFVLSAAQPPPLDNSGSCAALFWREWWN